MRLETFEDFWMAADVKSLALRVLQRQALSLVGVETKGAKNVPRETETPATGQELPPLAAERGYLTVADLPELERRMSLSGWKVERRGNELLCWTGRKPRIQ
jgi:hypothetical protein